MGAVVVAATFETDQAIFVGIATDESVTAVELRCAVIRNPNVHREAGAIELNARRAAPAINAALAI